MRDDAVLGRALPLDRGLGPAYNKLHTKTTSSMQELEKIINDAMPLKIGDGISRKCYASQSLQL